MVVGYIKDVIPRLEMASMDISKVGWLSYDSAFLLANCLSIDIQLTL